MQLNFKLNCVDSSARLAHCRIFATLESMGEWNRQANYKDFWESWMQNATMHFPIQTVSQLPKILKFTHQFYTPIVSKVANADFFTFTR